MLRLKVTVDGDYKNEDELIKLSDRVVNLSRWFKTTVF